MIRINRFFNRSAIFAAAAVLVACGGGGGGGGSASGDSGGGGSGSSGGGDSTTTVASTSVSGTAAKGLLKNALVTAYCGIKSTNNAIGTTTTNDKGQYSLTITQTCAQPIQVVVSAVAGTKMLDEIAGEVDAPSTLSLRAFVPSTDKTISLPVTPFTDMAAAIVENSVSGSNTLSASMVSSANTAIVTNVLGGNAALLNSQPLPPTAYSDEATSEDQKKLIVLLAAISQAAQSESGTTGEKVQKVLTRLSNQAKQTIPSVTSTGYTVSSTANTGASNGSTSTPLATIKTGLDALNQTNSTTHLGAAADTIKTSATTVKTSVVTTAEAQVNTNKNKTVSTPSSTTQTAIASATKLLLAVRTNLLSLVNSDDKGFLQVKSKAVTEDINSLNLNGTYTFTDILVAAHRATGLLAQTKKALADGGGPDNAPVHTTYDSNEFGLFYKQTWTDDNSKTQCSAYYAYNPQNPTGTLTANVEPIDRISPLNSNRLNGVAHPIAICNKFIYGGDRNRMMQFVVKGIDSTVSSGPTIFSYLTRIRTWANASCTSASDPDCGYTDDGTVGGTLTATIDSKQTVTALSVADQPVFSFLASPDTASRFSVNYTASETKNVKTLAFSGSVTSGLANKSTSPITSVSLKYGFSDGSKIVMTDTSDGNGTSGTIKANVTGQVQTRAFQYDGTFTMDGSQASENANTEGEVKFTGKISTLSDGKPTTFLEGSLTGNSIKKVAAFSGKVTNGSAVNEISISSDGSVKNQEALSITILTPGYSFTASGTNYEDFAKTDMLTVTASDGTVIESASFQGKNAIRLKSSGGTVIGKVEGNEVRFEDGTYLLLN